MSNRTIIILNIRNIGNQPLHIGVAPIDEVSAVGTDLTPFDGDFGLFLGSGTAKLMPGKIFEIEQYRVNLGQIQNYIDSGQAHVKSLERLIDALEEGTG